MAKKDRPPQKTPPNRSTKNLQARLAKLEHDLKKETAEKELLADLLHQAIEAMGNAQEAHAKALQSVLESMRLG